MYTGFSNGIGKNQMITSPTIAMTQSIVDNAINKLEITDTGSSLFEIDETTNNIKSINETPIEASLFKITGTDEDIDADATNAVNKRYLRNKVDELDLKFETISDHEADMLTVYTKTEVDSALSLKANSADVYTKASTDSLLANKANVSNVYTKTDADARFINVDEPVEKLKRTEVIPITATIPTSTLTCASTSFSSSYQTINSSYAIKSSGTKHLVSSVSVSVSSGNISDLKLQLYLASGSTYAYTNNGDGTFSIDGNKQIYKSNGEVRLRYAKTSSSATDIEFQITAISISYDYSTTISEYYDKAETDALISNITIETPPLYNIAGTNASIVSSDIVRDSYVVTAGKHYLISFTMTLTDLKDVNDNALTYMPISAPYIVICKASNLTILGTIYGYLNPLSSGWCINCIGILQPDTTSETKFLLNLRNVHATYNTLTNPSILKVITLD